MILLKGGQNLPYEQYNFLYPMCPILQERKFTFSPDKTSSFFNFQLKYIYSLRCPEKLLKFSRLEKIQQDFDQDKNYF